MYDSNLTFQYPAGYKNYGRIFNIRRLLSQDLVKYLLLQLIN